MYLAIVLLPLLGAIIGAIIALAGARARFPGAEPSDDHHAPAHGPSVHVGGDHAVIHAPTTSPAGTTIITHRRSRQPRAPAPPRSSPPRS